MKRIALLILICITLTALLMQQASAAAMVETLSAAPEQELSAEAVIVIDRDSGLPLYEKNADGRISPASTTKMMTAVCAAEAVRDLDGTVVTVRQDVLDLLPDDDNSLAGLTAGEELTMRQLLYSLILPSGNDAALVIADFVSGSEGEFAQLMNRRAAELGCTDTNFVNPHGLAGMENYSTARDLARIAEAFMDQPVLAEIAGAREYTFTSNRRGEVTMGNTNLLLNPESTLYDPAARGIKTGTTSLGACFVSAAEQDGLRIICVVAGVPAKNEYGYLITPNPALEQAKALHTWAYESLERVVLLDGGTQIPLTLPELREETVVTAGETVTAVLPREQASQLTQVITAAEGLRLPLSKGDAVGEIRWYFGDTPVGAPMPLYLTEGISAMPGWLWPVIWIAMLLSAALAVLAHCARGRVRRRSPALADGRSRGLPNRRSRQLPVRRNKTRLEDAWTREELPEDEYPERRRPRR